MRSFQETRARLGRWLRARGKAYNSVLLPLIAAAVLVALGCSVGFYRMSARAARAEAAVPLLETRDAASIAVLESVPRDLLSDTYAMVGTPTADAWVAMIDGAHTSVDVAAFYVTLSGTNMSGDAVDGQRVLDALVRAAARVPVRLVVDDGKGRSTPEDIEALRKAGVDVRLIGVERLHGSGVQHAKVIVVDNPEPAVVAAAPDAAELPAAYVGSANLDFRALTWVRELGVVLRSPALVAEVAKFFHACWRLALHETLPRDIGALMAGLGPAATRASPATLRLSGTEYRASLSLSPFDIMPPGWDTEGETLIALVDSARESLSLVAMEFYNRGVFFKEPVYWDALDMALRRADARGVKVQVLVSLWPESPSFRKLRDFIVPYWRSLDALQNVQLRVIRYPLRQDIPYSFVSHAKYALRDGKEAWISTSNVTPDYFLSSAGIALTLQAAETADTAPVLQQLKAVWRRDWECEYTRPLNEVFP